MSEALITKDINNIIANLWSPLDDGSTPNVFIVLDGARDKRIEPLVNNANLEQGCLYAGDISYTLKRAAPHIVKLTPDASFTKEILTLGWGESWGVFFITPKTVSMASRRNNCRKISKVETPEGKSLIFRYQDPRVLRKFLPICDPEQLRSIFGNASIIAMENESGEQLIRYSVDKTNQKLSSSVVDVC